MWYSVSTKVLFREETIILCNIVGGVASPVMANIYLHELDNYLAELKVGFDQGSQRRRNPDYRCISQKN